MDIPTCQHADARCRPVPRGANDRRTAAQRLCAAVLIALYAGLNPAAGEAGEQVVVATYSAPLSRAGPGLLLRDILKGDDPQIVASVAVIDSVSPDVLVLTDFDYDLDGVALRAFAGLFEPAYPFVFANRPNSGMATGLDLDGNGRTGEARDAQGYGQFAGDGGVAILSRFPIATEDVYDFTDLLWRQLPDANLPRTSSGPFPSEAAQAVQRLSTSVHWIVPIILEDQRVLNLLVYAATPPVFDGPEDQNGLRNRDELKLWEQVLDGHWGAVPVDFVFAGLTNLDPDAGEGDRATMAAFLRDPLLLDPLPNLPTAHWPDRDLPPMRVSYVLPAATWTVQDAGVVWPAPDSRLGLQLGIDGAAAGPHRLVWVALAQ